MVQGRSAGGMCELQAWVEDRRLPVGVLAGCAGYWLCGLESLQVEMLAVVALEGAGE